MTAKEIRAQAWKALGEDAYWPFVGAIFILGLISIGFALPLAIGIVVTMFATGAAHSAEPSAGAIMASALVFIPCSIPIWYFSGLMQYSTTRMSLATMRREMKFELFWSGWGHGWKMFWTQMVMALYVQLWMLLLIVPGIVKAFSYAMTPYILVDHPDWTANECITESRRLMTGNRWRLFCLGFGFIGWWILAMIANYIAGGFATNFLLPYYNTAIAAFYEDLKARRPLPPL